MSKTIKNLGIGAVIIALLFAGYSFFIAGKVEPEALLSRENDVEEQLAVAQELLALLERLEALKIPTEIFADPAFRSLQDFSVELIPQPLGRENPFAPLE